MRSYILGVASLADPMSAKIEVSVVLRLDTCLTQLAVCMVPAALDNSVKLDRGQRTLPAGKDRVKPRESTAWNVLLYLDPFSYFLAIDRRSSISIHGSSDHVRRMKQCPVPFPSRLGHPPEIVRLPNW